MYTKRTIFPCCFLFLLNVFLFGSDFTIEDINGIWIQKKFISHLNWPEKRQAVTFGIVDDQFTIIWDDKTKTGIFNEGPEYNNITRIVVAEKRITIYFANMSGGREKNIVLEFISRDLFKVISSPYNSNLEYLCRIYDYAKKPIAKGIINNSRVRLRTKPELTGDVWFYLDNREKIEILGISEEKQQIGELEAYWYEVRISHDDYIRNTGLDGWVFGAYVDVDDKEALEERLKKKGATTDK